MGIYSDGGTRAINRRVSPPPTCVTSPRLGLRWPHFPWPLHTAKPMVPHDYSASSGTNLWCVRVRALARACLNTDTSSHTATPFSAHIARPRHFSDMRPQAHVLLDMHACIRLYVGQRNNRTRAALSDKCRSTCGSGYGSELTRRGGGDHGQRQKRVWGAKALTKHQSPPSCTARPLPRCTK